MKKITIMLTAVVMLFATSAFAMEGDNVTAKVKAGFNKEFTGATQVSWEKVSDFYFANFQLNGRTIAAAYNEAGELVGTSKSIKLSELPLSVSQAVTEKYGKDAMWGTATELNYDGATSYYVSVKNNEQALQLKCSSEGDITVKAESKK